MSRLRVPNIPQDYTKLADRFTLPCLVRYLRPLRRFLNISLVVGGSAIARTKDFLGTYELLTRMMPHEEFDGLTEFYCSECLNKGHFTKHDYNIVMRSQSSMARIQSAARILKFSMNMQELVKWKREYLHLTVDDIVALLGIKNRRRYFTAIHPCGSKLHPLREQIISLLNKLERREQSNYSYDLYFSLRPELECTIADEVME